MTDPNTAQGAVLITALNEQLHAMTPRLILAERQADSRHGAAAQMMRQVAAELRRDVAHVQSLIAQLRRRFPNLNADGTVVSSNGQLNAAAVTRRADAAGRPIAVR